MTRYTALACLSLLLLCACADKPAEAPAQVMADSIETTHMAEVKPFFRKQMLLGAHRGGEHLWPENTLVAFAELTRRWPDAIVEVDARLTADGRVMLMHDDTVDRVSDGAGPFSEKTHGDLKQLDAAYRFTLDGGQTFPFRGQGVTVPTLEEALEALPDARFQIEFKGAPELADAGMAIIQRLGAFDRVLLCSFYPATMRRVRELAPGIATCYDFDSAAVMLEALRSGDWDAYTPTDDVLSVMEEMLPQYAVTADEIRAIRDKGILFQVHTPNRAEPMRQYIEMGADSILTDRPDILAEIIAETAG